MNVLGRVALLAGLDLKAVGADNLRRAMDRALRRLSLETPGPYLDSLASSPEERRLLAGDAIVQESWFFRDPDAYAGLARLAGSLKRPVRVLSVPCAAGEEPASIALCLVGAGLAPEQFLIDAADANPAALARARTGRFGPASIRNGHSPFGPYLKPDGPDAVLAPEILARIRFLEADVLGDSFLTDEPPYPVIFCRHLLIYLSPPARVRLAGTLSRLLDPRGAFFTTPAETCPFMDLGLTPYPRVSACPAPAPTPPAQKKVPAAKPRKAAAARARSEAAPNPLHTARALADSGRWKEALTVIDSALSQAGPSASLYHLKGAVLLSLGNDEDAEEALRRAVYLDPGHHESLTHLELLSQAKGRIGEAALLADRAKRARQAGS